MDSEDILDVVDHETASARQVTAEQELTAIRHLENQLHGRFPTVSAQMIDQVVETRYHELDDCTIRDYVPVLVEHAAKDDLRRYTHN